jgi:hypothetical protein
LALNRASNPQNWLAENETPIADSEKAAIIQLFARLCLG